MSMIEVFALANPNQFTGYEQTRIMDLITVLAFASLILWAVVLAGMVARRLVIIVMAIVAKRRHHQQLVRRKVGMNNGS